MLRTVSARRKLLLFVRLVLFRRVRCQRIEASDKKPDYLFFFSIRFIKAKHDSGDQNQKQKQHCQYLAPNNGFGDKLSKG